MKGLWTVLAGLADTIPDFRNNLEIRLVGKVDSAVTDEITALGLLDQLAIPGYVSHDKVALLMKQSAVLLLVINQNSPNAKGILTGKIFEYLASGRPILAIGPTEGDLAKILEESEAGIIVGHDDLEGIKTILMNLYDKYLQNNLLNNVKSVEKYTRKNLTAELADALNKISN